MAQLIGFLLRAVHATLPGVEATTSRKSGFLRLRHCLLLLALVTLSVPWYWPEGQVEPFILGMPSWAAASFGVSFLFAVTTVLLIVIRWKEDDDQC